jgi:hypothetical protein
MPNRKQGMALPENGMVTTCLYIARVIRQLSLRRAIR